MASEGFFSDIENLLEDLSNSASEIHTVLKNLYRITKKYSFHVSNPSSLSAKECNLILSLMKSLISILLDNAVSTDIMLLCGTCFALLISTMFSPEIASSFLMYTYCNFDKKNSGTQAIPYDNAQIIEDICEFFVTCGLHITVGFRMFEDYSQSIKNSPNLKTSSFQQIVILNGIVSCQATELYLHSLDFFHKKPFLILIFEAVYQCCLTPSVHQYHAFLVLLNWLKMCEEVCIYKFHSNGNTFFATDSDIVQKLLNLLESNWQSPIKGINGRLKELYNSIIRVNKLESKIFDLNERQFILYLLEKTMVLSWQVKGKYFLLSVILQNMDYNEFLNTFPDAPTKIIFSLKANYISSSVAEVYKVIVSNMKKCNSDEQFSVEWCKWWRDPILNSLKSNDRLLIQNVTNNLLSWTMKEFPKSYKLMMEAENHNNSDSVKLLLLRVAKECFPFALGNKELNLIEKNLHHCDTQVRSEVFSILCSSPKKSESVNSVELEYLRIFILENLNIDSASFHQYLLSQLHTLLVRIRDSLVQEFRSKIQIDESSIDMPPTRFVDWLFYTAVQNTFPGACFQRRRVCLQILNIIFDVFIESAMAHRRKENPSKSVEKVIKWAQKNNLWLFFNDDSLTYVFPCITDYADEIRSLCANLLCSYTSWPTLENCEAAKEANITEFALTLCNHPDYRNNDGGAHICYIIFNRLHRQTEMKDSLQALEFLKYLVSECKFQLKTSKNDFLSAAMQMPIHGVLLALQYCLANSKSFFIKAYQHQKDEISVFLRDLIHLCFDIVDYMLKIMKGENENDYCPSFSDIGKAMEKLVLSQKNSSKADYESSFISNESENESSGHSALCDLLLSCCWHSIKNSCFLLCELSSVFLALNIHSIEKKKFLCEIAQKLSSVLIDCRHRGVVEACCGALNNFCVNLLKDKNLYEDITLGLLKEVFENLSDYTKVSVTRRSAGIPLLFQAVVSSEGNNINRQLLPYTIENLLNLINHPLPSPDSLSEKTDLPQAHAYHILKALVSDARMSQSILPYFDSVIPVCITGFSSTVWAVRNGALQLFGVILPRVCGQKKVRDDDSEHNTVSAFELFARCPSLKTYLLQELSKCVKFHHEKRLCSELVPILSLLVKLMPERDDQRQYMLEFIPLLFELSDIPVWKVRDLVASALALLMHSSEIANLVEEMLYILENKNVNANEIHTHLLIVRNFMKRRKDNISSNVSLIEENLKKIHTLIQAKLNFPLLLGTILDMLPPVSDAKNYSSQLEFIDNTMIDCTVLPIGILFYENKVVSAGLKSCALQSIPVYVNRISSKNKSVKIVCLQFLSAKLNSEKTAEHFYTESNLKLWKDIFVSVLKYLSPEEHPSVILEALKFMINLSNDDSTGKAVLHPIANFVMEGLECHLHLDSGLSVSAYAFSMWSLCIKHLLVEPIESIMEYIKRWNLLFCAYCQPRSSDILRFQAATSLANLGPLLVKYLASNIQGGSDNAIQAFIDICEGSLLLLQDEDDDIRQEASKFPSQIPNNYMTAKLQFNVGIQVIVHYMLQVLRSESFYMLYLWNRHQNYPSTVKILQSYSIEKKSNLFEQEYVNVFSEPHQLLMHHYFNFKEVLSDLNKENYELYHEQLSIFVCDLEAEIEDVNTFLHSIKTENSNHNYTFHHQVYLSLKKIRCQVEVLLNQKHSVLSDDPLGNKLTSLEEKWNSIEKLLPSSVCWFLNVL